MEPERLTHAGARFADHTITAQNRWDHLQARLGVNRGGHRVDPGVYALGSPTADSPVFVSANYTLSFDALRAALAEMDAYILVLDTKGVNVWCAAGEGTFGTAELVARIGSTRLAELVRHRTLILPQLGAPGVSAHEVKQLTGFQVEYGPVRAADLPEYLTAHQATDEMRRVHFGLADRLVLVPIEVVHALGPMFIGAAVAFLVGGGLAAGAVIAATLAGVVLFPILLPWLPSAGFASKGFVLGGLVALPFAAASFLGNPQAALWMRLGGSLTYLLPLPALTSILALLFTGSSTFTSRTGVRREIMTYVPVMAWSAGAGLLLLIALSVVRALGGLT